MNQVVANLKRIMLENGVHQDCRTGMKFFTGYSFQYLFDIDVYFESIILNYMGVTAYSRNSVILFLEQQRDDGFIPRIVHQREPSASPPECFEHCKPFLAQVAVFISQYDGDFSWITRDRFYQLRRYLMYWLDQCDRNGNGLSEWSSAPHGGADNQFERVGGWHANFCEAVDLNCYLFRECLALARIADQVGERQQAIDLRMLAMIRKETVQRILWDPEDQFFYDRNRFTGDAIKVKYLMSFMSLWAEVATPEQAEASVRRYLLDETEFWTPYPLSTYAQTEPTYRQEMATGDYSPCNFHGCVWIPYNYLVMHGLKKYGFTDAARRLANKTFQLYASTERPREWFNSETGEGYGQDPFWGFSGVAPFMPLELKHGCDPTALEDSQLRHKMDRIRDQVDTLE